MRRRCRGAAAYNGRKVAIFLHGEAEFRVELGTGNRGKTETGLGGIVQMRTDVGEVGEGHYDDDCGPLRPSRKRT